MNYRMEIRLELRRIKLQTCAIINLLERKIDTVQEDLEKVICVYEEYTIRQNHLEVLYSKTIEQINETESRLNPKNSEQICMNCRMLFVPRKHDDQLICYTHIKGWNGAKWECCFDEKLESAGCILGTHKIKDQVILKSKPIVKCGSCKEQGHSAAICPIDPNIRSKANQNEELERISRLELRKHKKQMRRNYSESSSKPFGLLMN